MINQIQKAILLREIEFKALSQGAIIPKKATDGAIAFDVYTPSEVKVEGHRRQIIPLDFAIALPLGFEAKIEPRSGFSAKGFEGYSEPYRKGMKTSRYDCDVIQGKVDSDYRGCVGVIVNNHDGDFWLERGMRIAQMTIYRSLPDWQFVEVTELDDTERGTGGFGHTGIS